MAEGYTSAIVIIVLSTVSYCLCCFVLLHINM